MKKGISLVSLAIVVVVMIILTGIMITSLTSSIEEVTLNKFTTEILSIQNSVDEYYYRYEKYPTGGDYSFDIAKVPNASLSQFANEVITSNAISFKLVDLSLIGTNDTNFGSGNGNSVYVLSESTGIVYYLAGVPYENKVYYTLTDELYTITNMTNSGNLVSTHDVNEYDVIFSVSDINYTNNPITIQVKLPKEAIINNIAATEEKSISTEALDGIYKVISVNETSADKTGNYSIEVNYTYNGSNKTAKYQVNNFDNISPVLSVKETKADGMKTISVQAQDEISGIKTVKYVAAIIQDESYFENYGKELNGTQLKLDEDSEYTIYVEDKAGNYKKIISEHYAIYSATDNSLTFTLTGEEINEGSTYNSKQITKAYTNFEKQIYTNETDVPWYNYRTNITNVLVENTISPVSTKRWFQNFNNCTTLNLEKLDTSKVTDMSYMFQNTGNSAGVTEFTIKGTTNWNTAQVTNMKSTFQYAGYYATEFDIGELSSWDTSKVTSMNATFDKAGYTATTFDIGKLNNWDTSKVTDMSYMFQDAGRNSTTWNIGWLNTWETDEVITMQYMFSHTGEKTTTFGLGNLDNWNTSNVTNMQGLFNGAGKEATSWNIGNLDNWDTSKVKNMSYMFQNTGSRDTTWSIGELTNWNTSSVENMHQMFQNAGANSQKFNLGNLDMKVVTKPDGNSYTAWDTSNVKTLNDMFQQAGKNASLWNVGDISNWNTSNVTNMSGMFQNIAYNVKEETIFNLGDLSNWDTSKVTDMSDMFYGTARNADWSLNLSGWTVDLVTSYQNFNTYVTTKVTAPNFK